MFFGFVEGLRVLAAVACVLAALRYSPGDRLHAAWLLFALNLVLLLAKDVLFGAQLHLVERGGRGGDAAQRARHRRQPGDGGGDGSPGRRVALGRAWRSWRRADVSSWCCSWRWRWRR